MAGRTYTLGICAHVDAGKTTLSEQLLFQTGAIRAAGRVDHGNTVMDTSSIERKRGITVFADQADFSVGGDTFTIVDTPGHIDFASEAERSLTILDLAILLIDGSSGVRPYTASLFRLLKEYHVPTVLFVNKTDLPSFDRVKILNEIEKKLTGRTVTIDSSGPCPDELAIADDAFCERFLSGETSREEVMQALARGFAERNVFPLLWGSAIAGEGVDLLLNTLSKTASSLPEPSGKNNQAVVYKVRRDGNGERITFLKIQSGIFRTRDVFHFGDREEKIHQLRKYKGENYTQTEQADEGSTIGITGLTVPKCGDVLCNGQILRHIRLQTAPVLSARVKALDATPETKLYEKLKILEDEDPLLCVQWDTEHAAVLVQIMGTVQEEVLVQILEERFGIKAAFLPPTVLYRETVAAPSVGCGHYEPLRHYAECHLRLSPSERGSGITYESLCHVDDLPVNYQSQIRGHVFEKQHRGILIGAPLTDVHISLLSGKAHLKHTEGGDFREAVYRAVRQGLRKAQCILLEPYYRFSITVPQENIGRVLTDVQGMAGTCFPPETAGSEVTVAGRAPVSSMMEYPTVLRAFTHGKGSILLESDGYDVCHNASEVIEKAGYSADADTQNPCSSVFCSHGAGYTVGWDEADSLMHLPVETAVDS